MDSSLEWNQSLGEKRRKLLTQHGDIGICVNIVIYYSIIGWPALGISRA